MRNKAFFRIGSFVLAVVLVIGLIPISIMAEVSSSLYTIDSFDELDEDIAHQTVKSGTAAADLNLPDKLAVTLRLLDEALGESALGESVLGASGEVEAIVRGTVAVDGWESFPTYTPDEPGSYIFTPVLPDEWQYNRLLLPQITIEVLEGFEDITDSARRTIEVERPTDRQVRELLDQLSNGDELVGEELLENEAKDLYDVLADLEEDDESHDISLSTNTFPPVILEKEYTKTDVDRVIDDIVDNILLEDIAQPAAEAFWADHPDDELLGEKMELVIEYTITYDENQEQFTLQAEQASFGFHLRSPANAQWDDKGIQVRHNDVSIAGYDTTDGSPLNLAVIEANRVYGQSGGDLAIVFAENADGETYTLSQDITAPVTLKTENADITLEVSSGSYFKAPVQLENLEIHNTSSTIVNRADEFLKFDYPLTISGNVTFNCAVHMNADLTLKKGANLTASAGRPVENTACVIYFSGNEIQLDENATLTWSGTGPVSAPSAIPMILSPSSFNVSGGQLSLVLSDSLKDDWPSTPNLEEWVKEYKTNPIIKSGKINGEDEPSAIALGSPFPGRAKLEYSSSTGYLVDFSAPIILSYFDENVQDYKEEYFDYLHDTTGDNNSDVPGAITRLNQLNVPNEAHTVELILNQDVFWGGGTGFYIRTPCTITSGTKGIYTFDTSGESLVFNASIALKDVNLNIGNTYLQLYNKLTLTGDVSLLLDDTDQIGGNHEVFVTTGSTINISHANNSDFRFQPSLVLDTGSTVTFESYAPGIQPVVFYDNLELRNGSRLKADSIVVRGRTTLPEYGYLTLAGGTLEIADTLVIGQNFNGKFTLSADSTIIYTGELSNTKPIIDFSDSIKVVGDMGSNNLIIKYEGESVPVSGNIIIKGRDVESHALAQMKQIKLEGFGDFVLHYTGENAPAGMDNYAYYLQNVGASVTHSNDEDTEEFFATFDEAVEYADKLSSEGKSDIVIHLWQDDTATTMPQVDGVSILSHEDSDNNKDWTLTWDALSAPLTTSVTFEGIKLEATGDVSVPGGKTLTLTNSPLNITGDFIMDDGASLNATGSDIQVSGRISIGNGATIILDNSKLETTGGDIVIGDTVTFTATGSAVTASGNVTIGEQADVTLTSSPLNATSIDIGGNAQAFTATGSAITATGNVTVGAQSDIILTNSPLSAVDITVGNNAKLTADTGGVTATGKLTGGTLSFIGSALSATGGITADSLTVNGGSVSVSGDIDVDTIEFTDATVTATDGSTVNITGATKLVINGTTINGIKEIHGFADIQLKGNGTVSLERIHSFGLITILSDSFYLDFTREFNPGDAGYEEGQANIDLGDNGSVSGILHIKDADFTNNARIVRKATGNTVAPGVTAFDVTGAHLKDMTVGNNVYYVVEELVNDVRIVVGNDLNNPPSSPTITYGGDVTFTAALWSASGQRTDLDGDITFVDASGKEWGTVPSANGVATLTLDGIDKDERLPAGDLKISAVFIEPLDHTEVKSKDPASVKVEQLAVDIKLKDNVEPLPTTIVPDKDYDGTAKATLLGKASAFLETDGLLDDDEVDVLTASIEFTNANVEDDKYIKVTTAALDPADDGNNYRIDGLSDLDNISVDAKINPLKLIMQATITKPYDGTTTITDTNSDITEAMLMNTPNNEVVDFTVDDGALGFTDANAGTKTVEILDAGKIVIVNTNYTIDPTDARYLKGIITPIEIDVQAHIDITPDTNPPTKTYDAMSTYDTSAWKVEINSNIDIGASMEIPVLQVDRATFADTDVALDSAGNVAAKPLTVVLALENTSGNYMLSNNPLVFDNAKITKRTIDSELEHTIYTYELNTSQEKPLGAIFAEGGQPPVGNPGRFTGVDDVNAWKWEASNGTAMTSNDIPFTASGYPIITADGDLTYTLGDSDPNGFVGTVTIVTQNYSDVDAALTFFYIEEDHLLDVEIDIDDGNEDKVYDGKAFKPEGTVKIKTSHNDTIQDVEFGLDHDSVRITYTGTDTEGNLYSSGNAPVNAGSYTALVEVIYPDNNEIYYGTGDFDFEIEQRDVSIRPIVDGLEPSIGDLVPTWDFPDNFEAEPANGDRGLVVDERLGDIVSSPLTVQVQVFDPYNAVINGSTFTQTGLHRVAVDDGQSSYTSRNYTLGFSDSEFEVGDQKIEDLWLNFNPSKSYRRGWYNQPITVTITNQADSKFTFIGIVDKVLGQIAPPTAAAYSLKQLTISEETYYDSYGGEDVKKHVDLYVATSDDITAAVYTAPYNNPYGFSFRMDLTAPVVGEADVYKDKDSTYIKVAIPAADYFDPSATRTLDPDDDEYGSGVYTVTLVMPDGIEEIIPDSDTEPVGIRRVAYLGGDDATSERYKTVNFTITEPKAGTYAYCAEDLAGHVSELSYFTIEEEDIWDVEDDDVSIWVDDDEAEGNVDGRLDITGDEYTVIMTDDEYTLNLYAALENEDGANWKLGEDFDFIWSSSNDAIAEVKPDDDDPYKAVVTMHRFGHVDITVRAFEGQSSTTLKIIYQGENPDPDGKMVYNVIPIDPHQSMESMILESIANQAEIAEFFQDWPDGDDTWQEQTQWFELEVTYIWSNGDVDVVTEWGSDKDFDLPFPISEDDYSYKILHQRTDNELFAPYFTRHEGSKDFTLYEKFFAGPFSMTWKGDGEGTDLPGPGNKVLKYSVDDLDAGSIADMRNRINQSTDEFISPWLADWPDSDSAWSSQTKWIDIKVYYEYTDGTTEDITQFPLDEPIEIELAYPDIVKANPGDYAMLLTHQTTDTDDLYSLRFDRTDDGIIFSERMFSPFAITWKTGDPGGDGGGVDPGGEDPDPERLHPEVKLLSRSEPEEAKIIDRMEGLTKLSSNSHITGFLKKAGDKWPQQTQWMEIKMYYVNDDGSRREITRFNNPVQVEFDFTFPDKAKTADGDLLLLHQLDSRITAPDVTYSNGKITFTETRFSPFSLTWLTEGDGNGGTDPGTDPDPDPNPGPGPGTDPDPDPGPSPGIDPDPDPDPGSNGGNGSGGPFKRGGSSSSSYYRSSNTSWTNTDFWEQTRIAIRDAQPGDTVLANAPASVITCPTSVLDMLYGKDVTLLIKWRGEDIIINGLTMYPTDPNILVYLLEELAALYGISVIQTVNVAEAIDLQNPSTGGDDIVLLSADNSVKATYALIQWPEIEAESTNGIPVIPAVVTSSLPDVTDLLNSSTTSSGKINYILIALPLMALMAAGYVVVNKVRDGKAVQLAAAQPSQTATAVIPPIIILPEAVPELEPEIQPEPEAVSAPDPAPEPDVTPRPVREAVTEPGAATPMPQAPATEPVVDPYQCAEPVIAQAPVNDFFDDSWVTEPQLSSADASFFNLVKEQEKLIKAFNDGAISRQEYEHGKLRLMYADDSAFAPPTGAAYAAPAPSSPSVNAPHPAQAPKAGSVAAQASKPAPAATPRPAPSKAVQSVTAVPIDEELHSIIAQHRRIIYLLHTGAITRQEYERRKRDIIINI